MMMVAKSVTRLIADMVGGKRESLTLAALPDTLLPTLICGEMRVKDAERAIEDATT